MGEASLLWRDTPGPSPAWTLRGTWSWVTEALGEDMVEWGLRPVL